MNFGALQGLVNGTEQAVFDYEVSGSAVSSISTGNILNGDEDGWYTIIIRAVYAAGSPANTYLQLNGDATTSNYGFRGIEANNTSVANASGTSAAGIYTGGGSTGLTGFSVIRIYAKSGAVRLINNIVVPQISGTTVSYIFPFGHVWTNTADNITSMTLSGANNLGVGTRIIILKSNNFTNGTPTGSITTPYIKGAWVRVGSQVLGSAASSVTFSGLDGDRDVVYYLSASILSTADSKNFQFYFNADTTNYGRQYLSGSNTTVAAARDTGNPPFCGGASSGNRYLHSNHLIFAKQGFIRPSISETISGIGGTTITTLYVLGNSWSVTNANITSLTINCVEGGSTLNTGTQIDLYALRPNG